MNLPTHHGTQREDQCSAARHRVGRLHRTSWVLAPAVGLVKLALIGSLRLYQRTLSPLLGPTCRFYPSCSEYWIQSIRRYGPWRGVLKGIGRLCRCHPLHPGGYDPP